MAHLDEFIAHLVVAGDDEASLHAGEGVWHGELASTSIAVVGEVLGSLGTAHAEGVTEFLSG